MIDKKSERGGGDGGSAEIISGDGVAVGGDGGAGGGSFLPGGRGGNARIEGKKAIAIGGKGGRGGTLEGGPAGDGMSVSIDAGGADFAVGGNGGEGGRPWRPALGGLAYPYFIDPLSPNSSEEFPVAYNLTDIYGLVVPGRGGDSGHAVVEYDGRSYSMNVLLCLTDLWTPGLIDDIDNQHPRSPQDWWDLAVQKYPDDTKRAMSHMKLCEDRLKK